MSRRRFIQPDLPNQPHLLAACLMPRRGFGSALFAIAGGLCPSAKTKRRLHALETLPEKHSAVRDRLWARFRDGD